MIYLIFNEKLSKKRGDRNSINNGYSKVFVFYSCLFINKAREKKKVNLFVERKSSKNISMKRIVREWKVRYNLVILRSVDNFTLSNYSVYVACLLFALL